MILGDIWKDFDDSDVICEDFLRISKDLEGFRRIVENSSGKFKDSVVILEGFCGIPIGFPRIIGDFLRNLEGFLRFCCNF